MSSILETFCKFSERLQNESETINIQNFRNQIIICENISKNPKYVGINLNDGKTHKIIFKICEQLISCIELSNVENIEGKFFCGITLISFITLLPHEFKVAYIDKIQNMLMNYFTDSEKPNIPTKAHVNEITALSLIHGFFNSNLINFNDDSIMNLYESIFEHSLIITIKGCMRYSDLLYSNFRNLNDITKKILEWDLISKVSREISNALCYVIIYNWENPSTNIRTFNSIILSNYLCIIDNFSKDFVDDVLAFPWNKAKYFCLITIISYHKIKNQDISYLREQFIFGLNFSLRNSCVVSAGADLYKKVLSTLDHFNEWYEIYNGVFQEVLTSKNKLVTQNFLNHILPCTVKKYPGIIAILINQYLEYPLSDFVEYPFIFILRLGRKFGIILEKWNDNSSNTLLLKSLVSNGLKSIDDDIRAQSIQLVCSNSKISVLTTCDEFTILQQFFEENINYDSTPFRQSILNSFTDFIVHLRNSFMHYSDINKKYFASIYPEYFTSLKNFFIWMYCFITENLKCLSNYQRKITSLQMFDIILKHLCEWKDAPLHNRSTGKFIECKIVIYLRSVNKWFFDCEQFINALLNCTFDPTNDIRDIAVKILMHYYPNNTYLVKQKDSCFVSALTLLNSKIFYEVDSGITRFKLVSFLYTKGDRDILILNDEMGTSHKDMIEYLIKKCEEQFKYHKEDIYYSINNNQPLHGLLSGINVYIKTSNNRIFPTNAIEIVNMTYDIVTFFLNILSKKAKSSSQHYPPSFAEMDKSIDYIISKSQVEQNSMTDDISISNAQKMVYSVIWYNLKACCELSNTLIRKCSLSLSECYVQKCLDINILVLTSCRHKGAIENAGITLGDSIKYLTSLGVSSYNQYLKKMLMSLLSGALSKQSAKCSVTRKSAGLSILVHRIITNDCQPGKPLFCCAVDFLVDFLDSNETKFFTSPTAEREEYDQEVEYEADEEYDSEEETIYQTEQKLRVEKNSPQAIALHLLCRLVADSSLSSHVMRNASKLILICFKYIVNKIWQIRNAALYLYGFLIPRVIGQISKSENGHIKAPISADEFFSHLPDVWRYIIGCLEKSCNITVYDSSGCGDTSVFEKHSNLVPILGMLSNMGRRYIIREVENVLPAKMIYLTNFKKAFIYFINLLNSPIYKARELSANIITSFYNLQEFYKFWVESKPQIQYQNELHGYLLILKNYSEYYYYMNRYTLKNDLVLANLKKIIKDMQPLITEKTSFICRSIYLEINNNVFDTRLEVSNSKYAVELLETIEIFSKNKSIYIGFFPWLKLSLKTCIQNCDDILLLDIIKCCIKNKIILMEGILTALKHRIEFNSLPSLTLKYTVMELLDICEIENKFIFKDLFEVLYLIIIHPSIEKYIDLQSKVIEILIPMCNIDEVKNYNYGYMFPLLCAIILQRSKSTPLLDVSKLIFNLISYAKELSNVDNSIVESRYFSAISVKHLTKIVLDLQHSMSIPQDILYEMKCIILMLTLRLLQDEDPVVRQESTKILFDQEQWFTHPNDRLRKILSRDFLYSYFSDDQNIIDFLKKYSKEIEDHMPNTNEKDLPVANIFENETKNSYWELELIQKKICSLITEFTQQPLHSTTSTITAN